MRKKRSERQKVLKGAKMFSGLRRVCLRVCQRETHLGTGTLMIVPSTSGFKFMLLSLRARVAAAVAWGHMHTDTHTLE